LSKRVLSRFLNPESIAIFGGGWATNVIQQLKKSGYQGNIWPVHPSREETLGIKCFASIGELPSVPDAAFIGVNREITHSIVNELREVGAGGAICFASGFREADYGGSQFSNTHAGDRQEQLVEAAGDMPILGPNCYGYLNYLDNVTMWPDQHGGSQCDGGVAIVAQSSNIAINMTMQKRGLSISHMITVGNQAQTGVSDLVNELLDDQRVTAIGLYLESFHNIRAFEVMAERARELGKTIVALKIGKSLKAQIATVTHTASLAGSAASSSALLSRLGIVEVNSIGVFLETLKLLDQVGALSGPRICSVSCSGGEASLMSDLAIGTAIEFDEFSDQQTAELAKVLGSKVTLANPLDYHTYIWGDVPVMTVCFEAVLKDKFDLTVFVLDIPRDDICEPESHECAVESIIAARQKTGANVAVMGILSENLNEDVAQRFIDAGVVPLHGMEESVLAIDAIIRAGQLQSKEQASPVLLMPRPSISKETETYFLSEQQSKSALADYGLSIPLSSYADHKSEIAEKANALAYPLVLKGLGIEHKTEAGAVRLGIDSQESLFNAISEFPECDAGYLIEEMADKPIAEMIVGVSKDDLGMFLLTIGAGGVLTEILRDTASLLLPTSREEISLAIDSLRISQVLQGYRGQDAANIELIIDAVESVARYAQDHQTTLLELDINPLFAGPTSAVAVDALIRHKHIHTH